MPKKTKIKERSYIDKAWNKRTISLKQKKFIDILVETWNATEAAAKAYNTKNRSTAQAIWSENLSKPLIKASIEDRLRDAKNMIYTIAMTWEKEDTRLRASQDIVDRNEGKPIQRVIQDTNVSLNVEEASVEELLKFIKK